MFYPFLFERGITLLLLWMLICAVRSIIVNLVALVTGCIICSSFADLKPVCFEFSATKAIEIGCSVYMWLSVNDFYIKLRSRRRSLIASKILAKTTQISDSDMSLLSSDLSYRDFDEESSEDSMMVKASVDWLMKSAFGTKHQNKIVEEAVGTQRFLNMSAEELKELQKRIKNKLCEDFGMRGSVVLPKEPSLENEGLSSSNEPSFMKMKIVSKKNKSKNDEKCQEIV
uniref:Phosphoglycerate kinase n=4 Tax=Lygus hesperus TaxID=30085 RepID=A0A0A9X151_LYGHE